MKSTDSESQIRATFRDTKKAQKKFREKLIVLIKENRPLNDDERDIFLDLLADSNFGLGTIECSFWFDNHKRIEVDNLEKFIRDLVFYDKSVVDGDFFFFSLGNYSNLSVDINQLWRNILSKCGGVNAEALAMSVRISKELISRKKKTKRISRKGYSGDNTKGV